MDDIVERLRARECKFCDEAADEIERLRAECDQLRAALPEGTPVMD